MTKTESTVHRVAMRLAEAAEEAVLSWKSDPNLPPSQMKRMIAAALSSHGLNEAVDHLEIGKQDWQSEGGARCGLALTALLGDQS